MTRIVTSTNILVVENDMEVFHDMERALSTQAATRRVPIRVLHARNLEEARRKFLAYSPYITSTSLAYPLKEHEKSTSDAGAQFACFIQKGDRRTLFVIYDREDGSVIHTILTRIRAREKLENKRVQILQKDRTGFHYEWGKGIIDAIFNRNP